MSRTPEEIHRQGLGTLARELGPADMIRFLQQFETGCGDSARARHAWVDATSLDDIRAACALSGEKRTDSL
jgi:hypothetical protein